MKGDYEDFQAFGRRKNKANSKPIKANMPAFLAGNPKHETRNTKRVERVHLKKQSQFAPAQNSA